MQEIALQQTGQAITNPGMGLYLYGTLNPEDMPPAAWFTPLISIGYFRDDWADIEPEGDDGSAFAAYFEPIFDLWVKRWGKRVSFRVMSANMHSHREHVTPKWVFDRGVPFVVHKGLYVDRQYDPVFWDERYLELQEQFIARLGRYLDGRPGLEFIDIGSIGEWGEMHLSRWTAEELAETGFTEAGYIAAYRRIIDAFARAFPNTRVFLNVGDYEAINDYAALRGLHFRQDGLTPQGPSANVGKRFYHPYSRRGVICNYEFHSGYEEMLRKGWGIRETFAKGLEDPISYLHLNVTSYWQLRDPPAELKEAVLEAGNRVGFRFALTRLRCNQAIRLDGRHPGRLLLEHTWRNLGVAPCHDSYALRWSLRDAHGRVIADSLTFPGRPTTLWWPGEEVSFRDVVMVPADAPLGSYRLEVAMVKPEEPAARISLDLRDRDAEGRYHLGDVRAERVARATEMVYAESFDSGIAGWSAAEGMVAVADPGGRNGSPCLLVTGAQPGRSWNYAAISLQPSLLPYSRYRLSVWMRVDAVSSDSEPPYFKLGVINAAGNWLTNFNTSRYDLSRLETWQRLTTYAETPGECAGGHLAIEKGVFEAPVTAAVRLDDVEFELLEAP